MIHERRQIILGACKEASDASVALEIELSDLVEFWENRLGEIGFEQLRTTIESSMPAIRKLEQALEQGAWIICLFLGEKSPEFFGPERRFTRELKKVLELLLVITNHRDDDIRSSAERAFVSRGDYPSSPVLPDELLLDFFDKFRSKLVLAIEEACK